MQQAIGPEYAVKSRLNEPYLGVQEGIALKEPHVLIERRRSFRLRNCIRGQDAKGIT